MSLLSVMPFAVEHREGDFAHVLIAAGESWRSPLGGERALAVRFIAGALGSKTAELAGARCVHATLTLQGIGSISSCCREVRKFFASKPMLASPEPDEWRRQPSWRHRMKGASSPASARAAEEITSRSHGPGVAAQGLRAEACIGFCMA